jgi:DNA primase
VILVEGEKCADWLRKFGFLAVCWPGGGNAAAHADWSPLAGRRVLAWPDADTPGLNAMNETARSKCHEVGAASFRMIKPEPDRPKGWDCADAKGWSRQDFVRWMQRRVEPAAGVTVPVHNTPAEEVTGMPAIPAGRARDETGHDVAA